MNTSNETMLVEEHLVQYIEEWIKKKMNMLH